MSTSSNRTQAPHKPPAIKTVTITVTTPSPTKTTHILVCAYATLRPDVCATRGNKKVGFQAAPSARVDAVERWIEDARAAGKGQGPWTEADGSDKEPLWATVMFGKKKGMKRRGLAWGDVHPKKLFGEEDSN